jgi:hypothetical protein
MTIRQVPWLDARFGSLEKENASTSAEVITVVYSPAKNWMLCVASGVGWAAGELQAVKTSKARAKRMEGRAYVFKVCFLQVLDGLGTVKAEDQKSGHEGNPLAQLRLSASNKSGK